MSAEQTESFTNAFNYTADDSGCITFNELVMLANKLCDPGPNDEEVIEILEKVDDTENNNAIDLNVFLMVISQWLSE